MQITGLHIKNFRFIADMKIDDIESALILVGTNNSGKSSVLDAIRAAFADYVIEADDFNEKKQNIEVEVKLAISEEDLKFLHTNGVVSQYKRYDLWKKEFESRLPSYQDGILRFLFVENYNGGRRYEDGLEKGRKRKDNRYIPAVLPQIYFIDTSRDLKRLQEDILAFQEDDLLNQMRSDCCLFDRMRKCNHCFQCIGLIHQKTTEELNAFETAKLLEYKLYQMNLNEFGERVNRKFHLNGGSEEQIQYMMRCDAEQYLKVEAWTYHEKRDQYKRIEQMGKGMRSIYMLSLLEAYMEGGRRTAGIIMMEDPEIFLHPQLQKTSGNILYRLSKKNQVIFSTHSPNLFYNFNSRQIRQIYLDDSSMTCMRRNTDINAILNDLGYAANDLMNVSFVFIVEGKQDKSRLPLLLKKYYSEVYDRQGNLSRIAIITTNSCTNIKTYANLKYMNQIYLRDQFLMIRDGDGQDAEKLAGQLCRYYDERSREETDSLPRVTRRNVLILKYYSFENYFLNPRVMAQIGILEKEEDFYTILYAKWKEYLYRIRSGKALIRALGRELESPEDVKEHMEEIKIHMRGHNLYDIFYGSVRDREKELLTRYIELAPREDFADILDTIDSFIYFDNRKK
ncbi:MAG: AAA family ATPase [Lachnospiraceae bacterium]|nr:AAA family ATPase [Lachnospiraceae bacterium]